MIQQNSTTRRSPRILGSMFAFAIAIAASHSYASDDELPPQALARAKAMKIAARVTPPRLIAVRTHHDMCPYCKQLAPVFAEIATAPAPDGVLFVTLDLSSPATQQQAALLAGALGIESIWTGDLQRIGSVTFIDASSKQIIATTRAHELDELNRALRDALDSLGS